MKPVSPDISQLLRVLNSRGLVPRNVELAQLGRTYLVNVYADLASEIITDSVSTGVDPDPNIALLKAFVEWIERRALKQHFDTAPSYDVFRQNDSDGVAAFPIFQDFATAARRARRNALAEATERFAWAHWWDQTTLSYGQRSLKTDDSLLNQAADCLAIINQHTPISELILIEPSIVNSEFDTLIFFAQLRTGGTISGGAAGSTYDRQTIAHRALSEMLRHSLAWHRIQSRNLMPKTFYERRLFHFASGKGDELVKRRLKISGQTPLCLPALCQDRLIEHDQSDVIAVHRCLYQDQPLFVGGDLERLCL